MGCVIDSQYKGVAHVALVGVVLVGLLDVGHGPQQLLFVEDELVLEAVQPPQQLVAVGKQSVADVAAGRATHKLSHHHVAVPHLDEIGEALGLSLCHYSS